MDEDEINNKPFIGLYILDEEGNPVPTKDTLAWGQWFEEHPGQRHLAKDRIGNVLVSTVFLGLDQGPVWLGEDGSLDYKPTLWETMIFGGPSNHFQTRYTSKEEALAGHSRLVQMLTS